MLESRSDNVHVERLEAVWVVLNHEQPVLQDVSLTAQDVGQSLLPDTIEGVRDDGDEDVQEDDLSHYDWHNEPEPYLYVQKGIVLNV